MKECKFCGMPLEEDAPEKICAYCRNDDGREIINFDREEAEELAEDY
ncbi:MAG TPA: hypothetical protein PKZ16_02545 [bacterium]|nr:hypothetical protein [bacterium]HPL95761.1 hypothetical protein [bacterium]